MKRQSVDLGCGLYMGSQPGGAEQDPHQDYLKSDFNKARPQHPNKIPYSMIISIIDGTKLKVYEEGFQLIDYSKDRRSSGLRDHFSRRSDSPWLCIRYGKLPHRLLPPVSWRQMEARRRAEGLQSPILQEAGNVEQRGCVNIVISAKKTRASKIVPRLKPRIKCLVLVSSVASLSLLSLVWEPTRLPTSFSHYSKLLR